MKTKKPLKGFGVRADATHMKKAKKLGIDVSELFRRALESEISEREGFCPHCGAKAKGYK